MSVNSAAIAARNPLWISVLAGCAKPVPQPFKNAKKAAGIASQTPQKQPNSLTPTAHLLCVSRFLTDTPNGIGPDTPKNTEQS
ncbi:MAG: hypothetical protein QHC91_21135 [Shinella sp.]|jgi:hypothetical protein|nr:hypothetical protein [Shinella sp.]